MSAHDASVSTAETFMRAIASRMSNPVTERHLKTFIAEYYRLKAVADAAWNLHLTIDVEDSPEWAALDEALTELRGES